MSLHCSFVLTRKEFTLNVNLTTSNNIIAVKGHSGAGKTSLLRCIAGLEKSAAGYCYFNNQCWHDSRRNYFLPANKRSLGYVPQEVHLFPHMSVIKNIAFGYKRVSKNKRIARIDEVISWFGLNDLLDRNIKTLSGGERQRIAIARAILKSPELLLMDEPFTALDKVNKTTIVNGILNYQKLTNVLIIYVAHAEDETFIDQTQLLLHSGKIA